MVLQQTHAMLAAAFSPGQQARLISAVPEKNIIHIFLHFAVPGLLVAVCYRKRWWQSYLLLMLGMIIDVDHLLANPIYDPMRCSMGFHPLHTWPFVIAYIGLSLAPRTRLVGIGLVIHMLLDTGDCLLMPDGIGALQNFFSWPSWLM